MTLELTGPAYLAMKSRRDGWLLPGILAASADLPLPVDPGNAAAGPVDKSYYAPVRSAKAKVVREYGGINSSGGPQVSGRADQTDFAIEMNMHDASPVLYDHCCAGNQFEWVHLAVLTEGDNGAELFLHIRMKDVNVTGYGLKGIRKYFHQYVSGGGGSPVLESLSAIRNQDWEVYDVSYLDTMTLLYTSLSFLYGGTNSEYGWDTGSDSAFTVSA